MYQFIFGSAIAATLTCGCRGVGAPPDPLMQFTAFFQKHPEISLDVSYTAGKNNLSTGSFKFKQGKVNMAEYMLSNVGQHYIFKSDGSYGLEIWKERKYYDLLHANPAPVPSDRPDNGGIPFPTPYAVGSFQSQGPWKKEDKTDSKEFGEVQKYSQVVMTRDGKKLATISIGNNGELVSWGLHPLQGDGGWQFDFSHFTYGDIPDSTFSTHPPIGLSPYAFTDEVQVIQTDEKLPPIALTGSDGKPISEIVKTGTWMIVITDTFAPNGLKEAISKLPKQEQLLGIASASNSGLLKSILPSNTSVLEASEVQLNQLGVASTPQFYLFRDGKLLQAWLGYNSTREKSWLAEVSNALNPPPKPKFAPLTSKPKPKMKMKIISASP